MHLDVHYNLHIGKKHGHLIQLVRDMLCWQRDLHSSYFPQVTDCLAQGYPTVYEIQVFQQLKL